MSLPNVPEIAISYDLNEGNDSLTNNIAEALTDIEDLDKEILPVKKSKLKIKILERDGAITDVEDMEASDGEDYQQITKHFQPISLQNLEEDSYFFDEMIEADVKNGKRENMQIQSHGYKDGNLAVARAENCLTDVEDFGTDAEEAEVEAISEINLDFQDYRPDFITISSNFKQFSNNPNSTIKAAAKKGKPKRRRSRASNKKLFEKSLSLPHKPNLVFDSDCEEKVNFSLCKQVTTLPSSVVTDIEEFEDLKSPCQSRPRIGSVEIDVVKDIVMGVDEKQQFKIKTPVDSKMNSNFFSKLTMKSDTDEESVEGQFEENNLPDIELPAPIRVVVLHENQSLVPTTKILPLDDSYLKSLGVEEGGVTDVENLADEFFSTGEDYPRVPTPEICDYEFSSVVYDGNRNNLAVDASVDPVTDTEEVVFGENRKKYKNRSNINKESKRTGLVPGIAGDPVTDTEDLTLFEGNKTGRILTDTEDVNLSESPKELSFESLTDTENFESDNEDSHVVVGMESIVVPNLMEVPHKNLTNSPALTDAEELVTSTESETYHYANSIDTKDLPTEVIYLKGGSYSPSVEDVFENDIQVGVFFNVKAGSISFGSLKEWDVAKKSPSPTETPGDEQDTEQARPNFVTYESVLLKPDCSMPLTPETTPIPASYKQIDDMLEKMLLDVEQQEKLFGLDLDLVDDSYVNTLELLPETDALIEIPVGKSGNYSSYRKILVDDAPDLIEFETNEVNSEILFANNVSVASSESLDDDYEPIEYNSLTCAYQRFDHHPENDVWFEGTYRNLSIVPEEDEDENISLLSDYSTCRTKSFSSNPCSFYGSSTNRDNDSQSTSDSDSDDDSDIEGGYSRFDSIVKAEVKLLVKTSERGNEAIEIRSVREFVEAPKICELKRDKINLRTKFSTIADRKRNLHFNLPESESVEDLIQDESKPSFTLPQVFVKTPEDKSSLLVSKRLGSRLELVATPIDTFPLGYNPETAFEVKNVDLYANIPFYPCYNKTDQYGFKSISSPQSNPFTETISNPFSGDRIPEAYCDWSGEESGGGLSTTTEFIDNKEPVGLPLTGFSHLIIDQTLLDQTNAFIQSESQPEPYDISVDTRNDMSDKKADDNKHNINEKKKTRKGFFGSIKTFVKESFESDSDSEKSTKKPKKDKKKKRANDQSLPPKKPKLPTPPLEPTDIDAIPFAEDIPPPYKPPEVPVTDLDEFPMEKVTIPKVEKEEVSPLPQRKEGKLVKSKSREKSPKRPPKVTKTIIVEEVTKTIEPLVVETEEFSIVVDPTRKESPKKSKETFTINIDESIEKIEKEIMEKSPILPEEKILKPIVDLDAPIRPPRLKDHVYEDIQEPQISPHPDHIINVSGITEDLIKSEINFGGWSDDPHNVNHNIVEVDEIIEKYDKELLKEKDLEGSPKNKHKDEKTGFFGLFKKSKKDDEIKLPEKVKSFEKTKMEINIIKSPQKVSRSEEKRVFSETVVQEMADSTKFLQGEVENYYDIRLESRESIEEVGESLVEPSGFFGLFKKSKKDEEKYPKKTVTEMKTVEEINTEATPSPSDFVVDEMVQVESFMTQEATSGDVKPAKLEIVPTEVIVFTDDEEKHPTVKSRESSEERGGFFGLFKKSKKDEEDIAVIFPEKKQLEDKSPESKKKFEEKPKMSKSIIKLMADTNQFLFDEVENYHDVKPEVTQPQEESLIVEEVSKIEKPTKVKSRESSEDRSGFFGLFRKSKKDEEPAVKSPEKKNLEVKSSEPKKKIDAKSKLPETIIKDITVTNQFLIDEVNNYHDVKPELAQFKEEPLIVEEVSEAIEAKTLKPVKVKSRESSEERGGFFGLFKKSKKDEEDAAVKSPEKKKLDEQSPESKKQIQEKLKLSETIIKDMTDTSQFLIDDVENYHDVKPELAQPKEEPLMSEEVSEAVEAKTLKHAKVKSRESSEDRGGFFGLFKKSKKDEEDAAFKSPERKKLDEHSPESKKQIQEKLKLSETIIKDMKDTNQFLINEVENYHDVKPELAQPKEEPLMIKEVSEAVEAKTLKHAKVKSRESSEERGGFFGLFKKSKKDEEDAAVKSPEKKKLDEQSPESKKQIQEKLKLSETIIKDMTDTNQFLIDEVENYHDVKPELTQPKEEPLMSEEVSEAVEAKTLKHAKVKSRESSEDRGGFFGLFKKSKKDEEDAAFKSPERKKLDEQSPESKKQIQGKLKLSETIIKDMTDTNKFLINEVENYHDVKPELAQPKEEPLMIEEVSEAVEAKTLKHAKVKSRESSEERGGFFGLFKKSKKDEEDAAVKSPEKKKLDEQSPESKKQIQEKLKLSETIIKDMTDTNQFLIDEVENYHDVKPELAQPKKAPLMIEEVSEAVEAKTLKPAKVKSRESSEERGGFFGLFKKSKKDGEDAAVKSPEKEKLDEQSPKSKKQIQEKLKLSETIIKDMTDTNQFLIYEVENYHDVKSKLTQPREEPLIIEKQHETKIDKFVKINTSESSEDRSWSFGLFKESKEEEKPFEKKIAPEKSVLSDVIASRIDTKQFIESEIQNYHDVRPPRMQLRAEKQFSDELVKIEVTEKRPIKSRESLQDRNVIFGIFKKSKKEDDTAVKSLEAKQKIDKRSLLEQTVTKDKGETRQFLIQDQQRYRNETLDVEGEHKIPKIKSRESSLERGLLGFFKKSKSDEESKSPEKIKRKQDISATTIKDMADTGRFLEDEVQNYHDVKLAENVATKTEEVVSKTDTFLEEKSYKLKSRESSLERGLIGFFRKSKKDEDSKSPEKKKKSEDKRSESVEKDISTADKLVKKEVETYLEPKLEVIKIDEQLAKTDASFDERPLKVKSRESSLERGLIGFFKKSKKEEVSKSPENKNKVVEKSLLSEAGSKELADTSKFLEDEVHNYHDAKLNVTEPKEEGLVKVEKILVKTEESISKIKPPEAPEERGSFFGLFRKSKKEEAPIKLPETIFQEMLHTSDKVAKDMTNASKFLDDEVQNYHDVKVIKTQTEPAEVKPLKSNESSEDRSGFMGLLQKFEENEVMSLENKTKGEAISVVFDSIEPEVAESKISLNEQVQNYDVKPEVFGLKDELEINKTEILEAKSEPLGKHKLSKIKSPESSEKQGFLGMFKKSNYDEELSPERKRKMEKLAVSEEAIKDMIDTSKFLEDEVTNYYDAEPKPTSVIQKEVLTDVTSGSKSRKIDSRESSEEQSRFFGLFKKSNKEEPGKVPEEKKIVLSDVVAKDMADTSHFSSYKVQHYHDAKLEATLNEANCEKIEAVETEDEDNPSKVRSRESSEERMGFFGFFKKSKKSQEGSSEAPPILESEFRDMGYTQQFLDMEVEHYHDAKPAINKVNFDAIATEAKTEETCKKNKSRESSEERSGLFGFFKKSKKDEEKSAVPEATSKYTEKTKNIFTEGEESYHGIISKPIKTIEKGVVATEITDTQAPAIVKLPKTNLRESLEERSGFLELFKKSRKEEEIVRELSEDVVKDMAYTENFLVCEVQHYDDVKPIITQKISVGTAGTTERQVTESRITEEIGKLTPTEEEIESKATQEKSKSGFLGLFRKPKTDEEESPEKTKKFEEQPSSIIKVMADTDQFLSDEIQNYHDVRPEVKPTIISEMQEISEPTALISILKKSKKEEKPIAPTMSSDVTKETSEIRDLEVKLSHEEGKIGFFGLFKKSKKDEEKSLEKPEKHHEKSSILETEALNKVIMEPAVNEVLKEVAEGEPQKKGFLSKFKKVKRKPSVGTYLSQEVLKDMVDTSDFLKIEVNNYEDQKLVAEPLKQLTAAANDVEEKSVKFDDVVEVASDLPLEALEVDDVVAIEDSEDSKLGKKDKKGFFNIFGKKSKSQDANIDERTGRPPDDGGSPKKLKEKRRKSSPFKFFDKKKSEDDVKAKSETEAFIKMQLENYDSSKIVGSDEQEELWFVESDDITMDLTQEVLDNLDKKIDEMKSGYSKEVLQDIQNCNDFLYLEMYNYDDGKPEVVTDLDKGILELSWTETVNGNSNNAIDDIVDAATKAVDDSSVILMQMEETIETTEDNLDKFKGEKKKDIDVALKLVEASSEVIKEETKKKEKKNRKHSGGFLSKLGGAFSGTSKDVEEKAEKLLAKGKEVEKSTGKAVDKVLKKPQEISSRLEETVGEAADVTSKKVEGLKQMAGATEESLSTVGDVARARIIEVEGEAKSKLKETEDKVREVTEEVGRKHLETLSDTKDTIEKKAEGAKEFVAESVQGENDKLKHHFYDLAQATRSQVENADKASRGLVEDFAKKKDANCETTDRSVLKISKGMSDLKEAATAESGIVKYAVRTTAADVKDSFGMVKSTVKHQYEDVKEGSKHFGESSLKDLNKKIESVEVGSGQLTEEARGLKEGVETEIEQVKFKVSEVEENGNKKRESVKNETMEIVDDTKNRFEETNITGKLLAAQLAGDIDKEKDTIETTTAELSDQVLEKVDLKDTTRAKVDEVSDYAKALIKGVAYELQKDKGDVKQVAKEIATSTKDKLEENTGKSELLAEDVVQELSEKNHMAKEMANMILSQEKNKLKGIKDALESNMQNVNEDTQTLKETVADDFSKAEVHVISSVKEATVKNAADVDELKKTAKIKIEHAKETTYAVAEELLKDITRERESAETKIDQMKTDTEALTAAIKDDFNNKPQTATTATRAIIADVERTAREAKAAIKEDTKLATIKKEETSKALSETASKIITFADQAEEKVDKDLFSFGQAVSGKVDETKSTVCKIGKDISKIKEDAKQEAMMVTTKNVTYLKEAMEDSQKQITKKGVDVAEFISERLESKIEGVKEVTKTVAEDFDQAKQEIIIFPAKEIHDFKDMTKDKFDQIKAVANETIEDISDKVHKDAGNAKDITEDMIVMGEKKKDNLGKLVPELKSTTKEGIKEISRLAADSKKKAGEERGEIEEQTNKLLQDIGAIDKIETPVTEEKASENLKIGNETVAQGIDSFRETTQEKVTDPKAARKVKFEEISQDLAQKSKGAKKVLRNNLKEEEASTAGVAKRVAESITKQENASKKAIKDTGKSVVEDLDKVKKEIGDIKEAVECKIGGPFSKFSDEVHDVQLDIDDSVPYVTSPTTARRAVSQRYTSEERPVVREISSVKRDDDSDDECYIVTEPEEETGDKKRKAIFRLESEDDDSLEGVRPVERRDSVKSNVLETLTETKLENLLTNLVQDLADSRSDVKEKLTGKVAAVEVELEQIKKESEADVDEIEKKLRDLDKALDSLEQATDPKVEKKLHRVERKFERMASDVLEKDVEEISPTEVATRRENEFQKLVSQLSTEEVSDFQKEYSHLWDETTFSKTDEWDSKTPDSQVEELPQETTCAPITQEVKQPQPKPRKASQPKLEKQISPVRDDLLDDEDSVPETYSDKKKFWENVAATKGTTHTETAETLKKKEVPVPKPRLSQESDKAPEEKIMTEYQASFVAPCERTKRDSSGSDSDNGQQDNAGYISDSGDVEQYISDSEIEDRVPQIRERQMSVFSPPVAGPRKAIYERSASLPTEDMYEVSARSIKLRKQYYEEQIRKEMIEEQLTSEIEEEPSPERKTLVSGLSEDIEDPLGPLEDIDKISKKEKSLHDIVDFMEVTETHRIEDQALVSYETHKEVELDSQTKRSSVTSESSSDVDKTANLSKVSKPDSMEVLVDKSEIEDSEKLAELDQDATDLETKSLDSFNTETSPKSSVFVDDLVPEITVSLSGVQRRISEESDEYAPKSEPKSSEEINFEVTPEITVTLSGIQKRISEESDEYSPKSPEKELPKTSEEIPEVTVTLSGIQKRISEESDEYAPKSPEETSFAKVPEETPDITVTLSGIQKRISEESDEYALKSPEEQFKEILVKTPEESPNITVTLSGNRKRIDEESDEYDPKEVRSPIHVPEEHQDSTVWEVSVQSQDFEKATDMDQVAEKVEDDFSIGTRDESDLGSEIHQDHSDSLSDKIKSESQSDIERIILDSLHQQKVDPEEAKAIASALIEEIEAEIHKRECLPATTPTTDVSDYLKYLAETKGLDEREVELVESVLARRQRELAKLSRGDTQASSIEITDEDLRYSGAEVDSSHLLEQQISQLKAERIDDKSMYASIRADKIDEERSAAMHWEKDDGTSDFSVKTELHSKNFESVKETKDVIFEEDETISESATQEMQVIEAISKESSAKILKDSMIEEARRGSIDVTKAVAKESVQKSTQFETYDSIMKRSEVSDKETDEIKSKISYAIDVTEKKSLQDLVIKGEITCDDLLKKEELSSIKQISEVKTFDEGTFAKEQEVKESHSKIVQNASTKTHIEEQRGESIETKKSSKTSVTSVDVIQETVKCSEVTEKIVEFDKSVFPIEVGEIKIETREEIKRTSSSESSMESGKSPDDQFSTCSSGRKGDSDTPKEKPEVVLRKGGLSKPDRKSGLDFEMYSSSGESHYHSFELDSGKSRPCSSDIEGLVPGSSEYESALTSQEHSTRSHVTSTEYQTAVSSLSSKESMKSLDSESSGHLGSIEVSEVSETLVPSSSEAEGDILDTGDQLMDEVVWAEDHIENESTDKLSKMKRSYEMTFQPEPKILAPESPQTDDIDRKFTSMDDGSVVSMSISSTSSTTGAKTVIELSRADSERGAMTISAISDQLSIEGSCDSLVFHATPVTSDMATSTTQSEGNFQIESITITTSTINESGIRSVSTQVTSESHTSENDRVKKGEEINGKYHTEMKKKGHRRQESTSFIPPIIDQKCHSELTESDKYTAELSFKEVSSDEKKDIDESYETEADQGFHRDVREGKYSEEEIKDDTPEFSSETQASVGELEQEYSSALAREARKKPDLSIQKEYGRSSSTSSEKSSFEEAEAEAAFNMVAHVSPAHKIKQICPILEDEDAEKHELETREKAQKEFEKKRAQIRDQSPGFIPDIKVTQHMTPLVDKNFHYPDLELEAKEREKESETQTPQTPASSKSSEDTDQGREYVLEDSGISIPEEASRSSTVIEQTIKEEADKDTESPGSDSFEMLEKPDLIDDFVVIEEVAKEAQEFDSEGKSVCIQGKSGRRSKKHDEEVEAYLTKSAPTPLTKMTDVRYYPDGSSSEELGFDFEDSPPQPAQQTNSYDRELEANRKWIEQQFQGDQAARMAAGYDYEMEFERGPLEDIKEEDINDFDPTSSRIGSLGSQKESGGSLGSIKDSYSSTPEYDVLAGRKYFTRSGEHDDVSMSSLQEFENLERAMSLETKRCHQGSQDSSSNGSFKTRYYASKSGQGDDVSVSSLKEFEGLEMACIAVHTIETKAKEEEAMLAQIDEGQESLASESESCETISSKEKKVIADSDEEDYEKRMFEIDEIIKQAQTNVERFIDLKEADKTESLGRGDSIEEVSKVPDLDLDAPLGKSSTKIQWKDGDDPMIISTDSIEVKADRGSHHDSTDSLDQKTGADIMTASTDSIEFQLKKNSEINLMSDSIEIKDEVCGMVCSDSLELPKGSGAVDMLESTDSLDPTSSAATHATYQYESDSVFSGSFTSGGSNTMVSSTDTIDPIQVDIAAAARKVWFDEDPAVFTSEYLPETGKPYVTEIIEPIDDDGYSHTVHRRVELPPEVRKVTFYGNDADEKLKQFIDDFNEGEQIEEFEEVDAAGNVHTKRIVQKRVIIRGDGNEFLTNRLTKEATGEEAGSTSYAPQESAPPLKAMHRRQLRYEISIDDQIEVDPREHDWRFNLPEHAESEESAFGTQRSSDQQRSVTDQHQLSDEMMQLLKELEKENKQ